MRANIILLYDGECPICQRYSQYVDLRKRHDVQLYNAREHTQLSKQLKNKGFDINQGMILLINERIFHKHEAIVMLNLLTDHRGVGDHFLKWMIRIPGMMKISYPFLFWLRKVLLQISGKKSNM